MGGERDLLLARVGRGREPYRPPGERPRDPHPLGLVVGQRRRPSFSEPSTVIRSGSAPSSASCSPARSSWARMRSKRPSNAGAMPPSSRQRRKLRFEIGR